jgi:hypothetical protein
VNLTGSGADVVSAREQRKLETSLLKVADRLGKMLELDNQDSCCTLCGLAF